jgi:hypothetical protein
MKCFAGLAGYIAHVPVDTTAATIVSACAIGGTLLGSRICHAVPAAQLQRGFGIFVLCVAAILVTVEGSALLAEFLGVDRLVAAGALGAIAVAIGVAVAVRRSHASAVVDPSN